MGKKAAIISGSVIGGVALIAGVTATAIVLTQNNVTPIKGFSEQVLRTAYDNVNNYIKQNHVTVATVSKDANFEQHRNAIFDIVANTVISKTEEKVVKLGEYLSNDRYYYTQKNANLIFKINKKYIDGSLNDLKLDEGYIIQDKNNNSISFNNLALSSPDNYFEFNETKNTKTLIGLNTNNANAVKEPNILIPHGVTNVNGSIFKNNNIINNVVIPDTVNQIGESLFENASNLLYVKFSKSLKVIPKNTLNSCIKLTSFDWYEGLTEIGDQVFYLCESLTGNFITPKSVKKLGYWLIIGTKYESVTTWATSICSDVPNTFAYLSHVKTFVLLAEDWSNASIGSNTFFRGQAGSASQMRIYTANAKGKDYFKNKKFLVDNIDDNLFYYNDDQIINLETIINKPKI